ncbi:VOC family protein [Paenibacillus daejeonensis]|uniref:VOC family protein n=1 Tax=Paenibacillus daejeonensis TaxID=135193 RepID=UPI00037D19F1|nr:VOC family protein [Paenibacillus daejeonensis]
MNFHRSPQTYVRQVNLKVQDLQRSLAFYQELIGFRILEQTATTASLTADGKTALLTLEAPVEPKAGHTTGLYHYALLLPTRSDLARFVRHYAASGLRLGSSDHTVSEALYLSDPDGNGIEIYRDRDSSGWTWTGGEVAMAVDPLNFEDLLSEPEVTPWDGLPAGTIMGHIHLHVAELKDTERFYTQGLGFEAVARYGNQALFISTGGYHHHIGLNTWNGVGAPQPPEQSVGLRSYELVYPSEEAREQAVGRVRELGASAEQDGEAYVTADPSGNRIRLMVE